MLGPHGPRVGLGACCVAEARMIVRHTSHHSDAEIKGPKGPKVLALAAPGPTLARGTVAGRHCRPGRRGQRARK